MEKIYTLSTQDYKRLEPYIQILQGERKQSRKVDSSFTKNDNTANIIIDINNASKDDWMKLYGIGQVLSSRIINFREKLGGFYSIDQVAETYGIKDSVFQSFKSQLELSPILSKIQINTANKKELASHPYINFKQAQIISNYRDHHGDFNNWEDFMRIKAFDIKQKEKLKPYLSFFLFPKL